MGAPHGHLLHFHGHSAVHRLPAHLKLVALLSFVLVVVATPGERFAAFGGYLLVLLATVRVARVPFGYLLPRLVIEVPFLVFALLLPFLATGPRIDVGPLRLSEAGLLAAWTIGVKGTLGVLAALVLATTTEPRELIAGLQRLRLPALMVQILTFMLRYLDVVVSEVQRMRIARESRGFSGRSVRAWPILARSAGALFIRSYERGERVHLAMLSRGYAGQLPTLQGQVGVTRVHVAQALSLPVAALLVSVTAYLW